MLNLKNTLDGYLKNVEVIGNTIQDTNNLANIRSVGDKVEGQELYKIDVVSCGKNIFDDSNLILNRYWTDKNTHNTYVNSFLSEKFYKVKEGSTYTPNVTNGSVQFMAYDINKNFIGRTNVSAPYSYTVPNNVAYLRFSVYNEVDGFKLQIEEGRQSTSYEPYKESKLEILSPVQLEKVGDVADRIICKDGVWGVDKKVDAEVKNNVLVNTRTKSEFIPLPHDQQVKLRTFAGQTNIAFLTEIPGQVKAQVPKSFGATVNTHTEQIKDLHNSLDRVKKLEETTATTVETGSNFTTVDATNNGYFEDVKLDGKTLVNLWGNKSSDFRLSGQTSFNPTTQCIEYTSTTNRFSNCFTKNFSQYKPNTKYTIVVNVLENTFKSISTSILRISSDAGGGNDIGVSAETKSILGGFTGVQVFTVTTSSNLSSANIGIRTYVDNVNLEEGVVLKFNMIILEGDHTNNPPSYFEGLLSVGQDVEGVSIESRNANLFDCTNIYVQETFTGSVNTQLIHDGVKVLTYDQLGFGNLLKIRKGVTYYFKGYIDNILNVRVFPKGKYDHIDALCEVSTTGVNKFSLKFTATKDMEVLFRFWKGSGVATISNIVVSKFAETDHLLVNKKPLLYYNPTTETWEKPILREWDTIEKHSDGKYYYHKRSGEIVLNGSESNWSQGNLNGVALFSVDIGSHTGSLSQPHLCDKFSDTQSYAQLETTEYGMYSNSTRIYFRPSSNVSDLVGFKAWLKANPTTVVYQLAQEEIYECTNIDLMTYSKETNYIINSGAISPKSLLKVHNNISNVVKILQEKVSLLENTFIAGLKSVLSGDMYSLATILYPEDFEQNDNTEQDIMVIPE